MIEFGQDWRIAASPGFTRQTLAKLEALPFAYHPKFPVRDIKPGTEFEPDPFFVRLPDFGDYDKSIHLRSRID